MKSKGILLQACVAVGFLLCAGIGHSQVLEEITVTAQKREQNIQDVGISITAFSGEQIHDLGYETDTDITRMTAGVHMATSSAGQDQHFTIRGVTQNDFNDSVESPNAVYVDEAYIATVQGQRFGLFDIERVEILKGPQGTLFGRNATGGLVHYITRKPTDHYEGFGQVTYGRENQVRVEGAVSGPLTDRVSGRLSGLYNRHDPILNNVFPDQQARNPATGAPLAGSPSGADDVWDDDSWAVRGQLRWEINERAEILLSAYAAGEDISVGPYQQGATTPVINAAGGHVNSIFSRNDPRGCEAISAETGACIPLVGVDGELPGGIPGLAGVEDARRPRPGGDLWGYIDPDGDGLDVSTDHAPDDINFMDSQGVTVKLSWDLDPFTLTSVSSYNHYKKRQTLDVDAGPAPQFIVMNRNKTDSFTQELRLNGDLERARWVAGFYYLYIDNDNAIGLANSPDSPFTTLLFASFAGGVPLEGDSITTLETNSYSLFGQLDMDILPNLTFIAGLRTIIEDKDYQYDQPWFVNTDDALVDDDGPAVFPFLSYPSFTDSTSDTLWAGKLQFDYRPSDDWLIYAGINRGVKAGSFNAKLNDGSPPLAPEDIGYGEEILTAYEVGFKSTLFGGTTRFNGSVYFYDYDDYQAFLFAGSSGAVRNADAKIKGIEFEVATRPIDGLDFLFNMSFLDAEVTNLAVAPGVFEDVTPGFTPTVQLGGLLRYEWPAALLGGAVAAQMDANYASSAFHNIRNFEAQKMGAYVLGNARLSWTSADEAWEAAAFVKNLSDTRYKITGFDLSTLCGCSEEAYGQPRWWGISLRYNYF